MSSANDGLSVGLAVRVIVDGTWGFASTHELNPTAAAHTAARAVEVARTLRALNTKPVVRADEPVHAEQSWVSDYEIDPFTVPTQDKIALLAEWSQRLLSLAGVAPVDAACPQVKEHKFYGRPGRHLHGPAAHPHRAEVHRYRRGPRGRRVRDHAHPRPAGRRGWEYALGNGWDFDAELAQIPELLAERMKAPSV